MRIAIAMSGGVDSSLAAALLKKAGHEIFGVTMRQYDAASSGYGSAGGIEADIEDARAVCQELGIKHYVVDLQEDFKNIVERNFLEEYSQGRTPNPCVLCNPEIKFGKFLEAALALGADKLATGHYIQRKEIDGKIHIYIPQDESKDQTYMIWKLTQAQLAKVVFPLSSYTKAEVRILADDWHLPVHAKKDSQEICFIKDHYQEFLEKHMQLIPGDIVLQNGEILGQHRGLPLYTIGQRKGLGTPWHKPLFVLRLNVKKNQVIVTEEPDDLLQQKFEIAEVNWLQAEAPPTMAGVQVKIRYNSRAVAVESLENHQYYSKVILKKPTRAVTPGQSAVFYRDNELLGGGIIK
ncbi:MAG: tRNA 2-thiouridine(34) synthase MnmA [Candidatus Cloacimonadales bacterium]